MALIGAALLYRSRLRRLGRLTERTTTPAPDETPGAMPGVSGRLAFVVLLVCCLMIPSNWTQDIPSRYGARHAGHENSWLYPKIDTAARPKATNRVDAFPFHRQSVSASVLLVTAPVAGRSQRSAPAMAMMYEPRSRTPFPVSLISPGGTTPHWLMGTALRQRTIFRVKIYAFGLYVDPDGARASLSRFVGASLSILERDERFYRHLLDLRVRHDAPACHGPNRRR